MRKVLKIGAPILLGGVLVALSAPTARAQYSGLYQPGNFKSADVIGLGFDRGSGNGEPDLVSASGSKSPHFGIPSTSQVSASAEYERWGNGGNAGFGSPERYAGNRTSYVLSYQRELTPTEEVQVIGLWQRLFLHTGATNAAEGFSDTEVDARKFFINPNNPNAPEYIVALRGFLPTGNWENGIGLHQWGVGPSVIVNKSYNNTLGYAGLGWTYSERYISKIPFVMRPSNASPWYYWIGGATQINPKWMTQEELLGFTGNDGEQYLRGLIGVRYGITPSMGLQVNYKKEFRALGKAETLSIGWSDLF